MRRALIGLALVLALLAAGGWWGYARLARPFRGFTGPDTFVEIPPGTGVAEIARRLANAGAVPDRYTFRLAAYLAHVDRRLQAGEYRFAAAATPRDVALRIARGDVYTLPITFPEGLNIGEMANIFERSGLGTSGAFRAAAANTALIAAFDPEAASLEGYLFPDTYAVPRTAGATGLVTSMVAEFERAFDTELREAAAAHHLTARDLVTLASLVEAETAQPDERPLVAAVFLNRLRLGMPLQCDPTVVYALLREGHWTGRIHKTDLQFDSPYNTYRYPGLPPGPIASPGRSSLEAAGHPAEVNYLYFVSRNDGTHAFASTLAEHNRNVAKYQLHGRGGR